jgi:hypothetical protein
LFLGLLAVLSRVYLPVFLTRITTEKPVEEVTTIIVPAGGGGGEPSQSPAPKKRPETEPRRDEPLVLTPGPVTAIPQATPGPETQEPSDGVAGGQGGGGKPSLLDRLRPQTVDPRLNGGSTYSLPPDASPAAAVRARVAQTLREYNDSMASEADARRRALDWTIKTKDGKQWGIGPDGKIHLGDITLPAVAFSPPPGKRDEIRNRNRDWAEIEMQANNEIGRQSFNQRVKAIRARKEREREDKKKAAETTAPITH